MNTHQVANQKIGLTIIVLVAYMMLVRTLTVNVSGLIDTLVLKIAGGDLALIQFDPSFKKGKKLTMLDRKGITSLLTSYKEEYGLISEFSFSYNDINDITADKAQYYNKNLEMLFDFELRSSFTSMNIQTKTIDINHQKVTGTDELSIVSMYQPSEFDKSFRVYNKDEMVQMMYDLQNSQKLTKINMKTDQLDIIDYN